MRNNNIKEKNPKMQPAANIGSVTRAGCTILTSLQDGADRAKSMDCGHAHSGGADAVSGGS